MSRYLPTAICYNFVMKTGSFLLVFLAAAVFCRPAAAGKPGFPVCMYGIGMPEELAVLKQAGFNCFQTYAPDPGKLAMLAAEAEKQGLMMLAFPDAVIGSAYSGAARKRPVLAW